MRQRERFTSSRNHEQIAEVARGAIDIVFAIGRHHHITDTFHASAVRRTQLANELASAANEVEAVDVGGDRRCERKSCGYLLCERKSFKLMAPFGRAVIYGAKNAHDSFPTERVRQLIFKNQSVTGFNFPSLLPEQIGESVSALVELINSGQVKLFANHAFGLADVRKAFEALSNRQTIGKVVLTP